MKNITPAEANKILRNDKNAVLIDVRTKDEVSEIFVLGAKHIPLDELSGRLGEIKNFSSVLFLCRSGGRSAEACSIAESAGFPSVINIAGGIIAWEKVGLPVMRGKH